MGAVRVGRYGSPGKFNGLGGTVLQRHGSARWIGPWISRTNSSMRPGRRTGVKFCDDGCRIIDTQRPLPPHSPQPKAGALAHWLTRLRQRQIGLSLPVALPITMIEGISSLISVGKGTGET